MVFVLLHKRKARNEVLSQLYVYVLYSAGNPEAAGAQAGTWAHGAVELHPPCFLPSTGAAPCPSSPGWPAGCPLAKH